MLRLRPSEITLTPADVEETRRRMARRQAAQALPSTRSTRFPRPSRPQHVSAPRLLRGPEHSRNAAITHLGNIPLLEPHAAVHSSIEDCESDEDQACQDDSPKSNIQIDRHHDVGSSPARRSPVARNETPGTETLVTTTRHMELPFRLAQPSAQTSGTANPRETTEDDTPPSPPKHRIGLSVFGRAQTNTSEETIEDVDNQQIASTDGLADSNALALPRSNDIPIAHRLRSTHQHSSHGPSPLRQDHSIGSPRQLELEDTLGGRGSLGHEISYTTHLDEDVALSESYPSEEHRQLPHTEPRRRFRQPGRNLEHHAASSTFAQIRPGHRPQVDGPSSAEHDFWTVPSTGSGHGFGEVTPTHGRRGHSPTQRRPLLRSRSTSDSLRDHHPRYVTSPRDESQGRTNGSPGIRAARDVSQRLSEVSSSSSQPYSFYELPGSRHSSISQDTDSLYQSQYDGAGSSRHLGRGAYFSIRPSQVRAAIDGPIRPPSVQVSSFSSPDLTETGGQSVSPPPSRPSTRANSSQSTPRQSIGLISSVDLLGENPDAAIAAERDLPSPLDLLEQRATSYLSRIQAAQAEATDPIYPRSGDVSRTQERSSGSGSMRQFSGNNAVARPRFSRRDSHARSSHRSSENAPVNASENEPRREVRIGQAQVHRVSIGQIQPVPPQGVGLRGGEAPFNFARIRVGAQHSSRLIEHTRQFAQLPMGLPPFNVSPGDSRGVEAQHRPSPHRRRQQQPQASSVVSAMARVSPNAAVGSILQPEADTQRQTLIHSLGTPARRGRRGLAQPIVFRQEEQARITTRDHHRTLRGPPVIHASTSRRRLSPRQENQENSGQAEDGLMRQEIATLGIRYEDSQQLDVMDETPPRVGRFEQHIMHD